MADEDFDKNINDIINIIAENNETINNSIKIITENYRTVNNYVKIIAENNETINNFIKNILANNEAINKLHRENTDFLDLLDEEIGYEQNANFLQTLAIEPQTFVSNLVTLPSSSSIRTPISSINRPPLPRELARRSSGVPTSLPPGTKYEMQTLPVDPKEVVDGDGMTVYVDALEDRESPCIPLEVREAIIERFEGHTGGNVNLVMRANRFRDKITKAGYRVLYIHDQEILARKYRIRMRGIDAPETKQPYGKESQEELTKIVQGKCLRIFVYGEDQYGRIVGDIYCDGMFVQELMLKKGMAWHYAAFDKRIELALWENNARAKRVGLWASLNPQPPWNWRRENPREG